MPEHALVTGAASGIGRAIALTLAARGYRVTATDNRADALAGLDGSGIDRVAPMDVTDATPIRALLDSTGPADILVNSAGVGLFGPVEYCTPDEVQCIFEINYRGPLNTIQAVLPSMRQRNHGLIVNVTSMAGHTPMVLTGIYASLKMALDVVSETLSHELVGTGVRVVILEPGATATGFGERRHVVQQAAGYEGVLDAWNRYVKRRAGQAVAPEEVARALILALDSPEPALRVAGSRDVCEAIELRAQIGAAGWRSHVIEQLGLVSL
jgi:NAD(P)-dependent dehydrogenase (short-subunit alcohol dehydrogenase family)